MVLVSKDYRAFFLIWNKIKGQHLQDTAYAVPSAVCCFVQNVPCCCKCIGWMPVCVCVLLTAYKPLCISEQNLWRLTSLFSLHSNNSSHGRYKSLPSQKIKFDAIVLGNYKLTTHQDSELLGLFDKIKPMII